ALQRGAPARGLPRFGAQLPVAGPRPPAIRGGELLPSGRDPAPVHASGPFRRAAGQPRRPRPHPGPLAQGPASGRRRLAPRPGAAGSRGPNPVKTPHAAALLGAILLSATALHGQQPASLTLDEAISAALAANPG